MAIMLSDIELLGGLVWRDRWGAQRVSQTVVRTLGGLPVFYHASLHSAVNVTLESSGEGDGWQTKETVERLYALAGVAGAQYLLDFGPVQFSVMFRHNDGPALEATPVIPRTLAEDGDWFNVSLKLITV